MHIYRSHTCGALRPNDVGDNARISGWVHRKRDHGGLLFIDLRDNYGITQCVIEPDSPYFAAVEAVRPESVLRIEGKVVAREPETINTELPTGEVEISIAKVDLLSAAEEFYDRSPRSTHRPFYRRPRGAEYSLMRTASPAAGGTHRPRDRRSTRTCGAR